MASEAQINQKRLEEELAKPYPDPDVVYYLKTSSPYWNTIDKDAMKRGYEKIKGKSLQNTLRKLAPIRDKETK